ncbi:MAG: hypothetical protein MUE41_16620, partial [Gemmatimonadaceae bacterium]|nr:hypothetical protein [Gemmatimonadaceae bacterium]
MLTPETLASVQEMIAAADVDGWLLFDFRGCNPIALGVAGLPKPGTRRIAVWIPRAGTPTALSHAIEQAAWASWPTAWPRTVYTRWQDFEGFLAQHVAGKRVAMEYAPRNAIPYVDRIPAGVLDIVRDAGATVVSSSAIVTRLYAVWTPAQTAAHARAAEQIAAIAQAAAVQAGGAARASQP